MPLPYFLSLLIAVVSAAALTLLASFAVGLSETALALILLSGAAVLHLTLRDRHDPNG